MHNVTIKMNVNLFRQCVLRDWFSWNIYTPVHYAWSESRWLSVAHGVRGCYEFLVWEGFPASEFWEGFWNFVSPFMFWRWIQATDLTGARTRRDLPVGRLIITTIVMMSCPIKFNRFFLLPQKECAERNGESIAWVSQISASTERVKQREGEGCSHPMVAIPTGQCHTASIVGGGGWLSYTQARPRAQWSSYLFVQTTAARSQRPVSYRGSRSRS